MAETKREMESDDSIKAEVPQEIVELLATPDSSEAEVSHLQDRSLDTRLAKHQQFLACSMLAVLKSTPSPVGTSRVRACS